MEVLTEQDVNMINRILEAVVDKNTIVINSAVEICGNNKAKAIELLTLLCNDGCLKPSIPMKGERWNKTDTTEDALITGRYEKLRVQQLKEKERQDIDNENKKLTNKELKRNRWLSFAAIVISLFTLTINTIKWLKGCG